MSRMALVTGGAGFIGSHLVDALSASGHTVRVLDDLSTGLRSNLNNSPVELIQGCVSDRAVVDRAVQGVDVVYHLAAMASVARSLEDPLACHTACATGTLTVLDAARRLGVSRVVYAGSSSAYGKASDPAGQSEETPLNPLSPYATAKLAGEHYCEAFTASYGLETVRVRFFNIFGPRQLADSPYSGVIALFIASLMKGRTPSVHGDGLQARDFVAVSDAVAALMKAASTPGVAGQVYNVGTGRSTTVLDLVAALNQLLGTNCVPTHGPARAGDVRYSLAKITKIRKELNYEPAVTLTEGLKRTIDWYRTLNDA